MSILEYLLFFGFTLVSDAEQAHVLSSVILDTALL